MHEQFASVFQFQEGCYRVKLPWKDPSMVLPDNYELSLRRLHSLLNRLRQKPDPLRQYDRVIQDQVQAGIV